MKDEHIKKIQRLHQKFQTMRIKGKKVKRGPYWYGYWMENGKQHIVYVGKDLPPYLKYLIQGKLKRPGCKYYTWPSPKTMKKKPKKGRM